MKVEKPIMLWGSRVEKRGLNSLKGFRRKNDFRHRVWSEIGADSYETIVVYFIASFLK